MYLWKRTLLKKRPIFSVNARAYFSRVQIFFSFNLSFSSLSLSPFDKQNKQLLHWIEWLTAKSPRPPSNKSVRVMFQQFVPNVEKRFWMSWQRMKTKSIIHIVSIVQIVEKLSLVVFSINQKLSNPTDYQRREIAFRNRCDSVKHVTRKSHRNGEHRFDWNRRTRKRSSYDLVRDVRISSKHHRLYGKTKNFMNLVLLVGVLMPMEFNVEKFDEKIFEQHGIVFFSANERRISLSIEWQMVL